MIIGLHGNPGRGKTLSATFMCYFLREKTRMNRVVSNYQIDITTDYVATPTALDDKSKELKTQKTAALYSLDEIWAWMDSRESMENDLMTNIILNSRKRGCVIIYTSQSEDQYDKRLRKNTDFKGFCRHYEAVETQYDHDIVVIILYYKTETGDYVFCNKLVIDAEAYYGTYDTTEEIATTDVTSEYADTIDSMVERCIENPDTTKKSIAADLHLKEGISLTKAELMADMIKRRAEDEADGVIQETDEGKQSTLFS